MAKIKIVRGNTLTLSIPLTKRTLLLTGGGKVSHADDFYPTNPVSIILTCDAKSYPFDAQVSGNVATIEDVGTLPLGTYDVEVLTNDADGKPLRYKARSAVHVVDATCDAGIDAGIEFDGTAYYLDGAVLLSVKGDPGKDGLTPHIGSNGNWWIGDHDTGISAYSTHGNCYTKEQIDDMVAGITHAVNNISEDLWDVKPLVVPVTMNGSAISSRIDFGTIRNAVVEDKRDVIVSLGGVAFFNLKNCHDDRIVFSFVDLEERYQSIITVTDENEWSIYDIELEDGEGGYTPPAGGIPKSDLEQTVQDTLDAVSGKVDKVTGKGLSTNDYTTAEKNKLNALPANPVQTISVNGGSPQQPVNGNVDLAVSGGQGASGFTINETSTALVLTVWDGATVNETSTSITIQQAS